MNRINLLTGREVSAFMFISATMVFPRSYVYLKLLLLGAFLFLNLGSLFKKTGVVIHAQVILFYSILAFLGLVWALIGLLNGGDIIGVVNNLKLYVIWSIAFMLCYNILLQRNVYLIFHKAIVVSGVLVSILNLLVLSFFIIQLDFVPLSVIDELHAFIGIHDGYVQITSHNIGSLFFITAYLIAVQYRKDMNHLNTKWVKLSLFLCIIVALLSGRRGLWLCLLLVPLLVLMLSFFSGELRKLKGRKQLMLIVFVNCIAVVFLAYMIFTNQFNGNSTVAHIIDAFSADDERTIQKGYLLKSFEDYLLMGSGFGVSAGYIRSEQSPWVYELTYYQLLFNFGIVGTFLLFLTILYYVIRAVNFISKMSVNSGNAFCLLIGITALAIGSYSNPYFASFDFLLLIGVLPLIAASDRLKVWERNCYQGVST